MCKMASFWHNPITGDLAVYDLMSHSETQKHLELNENVWREGHYLPNGTVECRVTDTDRTTQEECDERLKNTYPTFKDFLKWAFTQTVSGWLDLRGCDLKGITFPQTVSGTLELRGCDLKGITLPQTVGTLDLRGCDLKGITLPQTVSGTLDLRGDENGYVETMAQFKKIKEAKKRRALLMIRRGIAKYLRWRSSMENIVNAKQKPRR